eukprot:7197968-Prorocentrum_lima.AAC.1
MIRCTEGGLPTKTPAVLSVAADGDERKRFWQGCENHGIKHQTTLYGGADVPVVQDQMREPCYEGGLLEP